MSAPPGVLVALDSLFLRRPALELGARMALQEGRRLTILVVENPELRQAAELPFMREIDGLSGALQPFQPDRLEAFLQQRVTQIRRWLVEIETRLSLPGGLEIRRGRYLETALAAVGQNDLLICGAYREWLSVRRSPVWVWYDGSPAAERALATGRELARRERCRLCLGGKGGAQIAAPAEGEWVTADPECFLDLLQRQGCTAVVCSRTDPLSQILPERARCPVILV
ncbi:hypothetical protein [Methylohalobius crimeensis]|uniref:hypothetical protein n=1 Tax=Methylohalobius crimeensis TaxID=244365 RepID=UPI0003B41FF1|nr:hypothetical protein [Methylohalobius crimeensis]